MKAAFLVTLCLIVLFLALAPTLCSAQAANTGTDDFGTPVEKPEQKPEQTAPDQPEPKPSQDQNQSNESKAAPAKTPPDQRPESKPTPAEQEKPATSQKTGSWDPTIVAAIISAIAAIVVGYWQFVYKPKRS